MGGYLKTKICSICGVDKSIDNFYKNKNSPDGLTYECSDCIKKRVKDWRKKNPEKKLIGDRRRRKNNIEKVIEQKRRWYEANKERLKKEAQEHYLANREKKIENAAVWAKENPDKVRMYARKSAAKKRATPKGKLGAYMSWNIYNSLQRNKNGKHWESLVDYTLDDLKKHLEKQFQPGMTWENYGTWHLDHKTPISAFNFEKSEDIDFKRCWALKNLQPLWAKENLSKGNKLKKPFQPSLIFK